MPVSGSQGTGLKTDVQPVCAPVLPLIFLVASAPRCLALSQQRHFQESFAVATCVVTCRQRIAVLSDLLGHDDQTSTRVTRTRYAAAAREEQEHEARTRCSTPASRTSRSRRRCRG